MTATEPPSVPISFAELLDALEFVSVGDGYEHQSVFCRATGMVFFNCDDPEVSDFPEDVDESDEYVSVPHKHELNLGRNLVFFFVRQQLPDAVDTVSDMFRRQGPYRRFKDFLERRRMLEQWYEYEAKSIAAALRAWCEENEIPLRNE